uniref:G-protein coupled receptors family 1 profile domain-containing protein n=1 Tax=Ditylenchus dipsaci TaxID=166011 RepID=A0A915EEB9_9BILA
MNNNNNHSIKSVSMGVTGHLLVNASTTTTIPAGSPTTTSSTSMLPSSSAAAPEERRSCEDWDHLFNNLNHYFREEDILHGSEHSSVLLGNIIIVAYSLVIFVGAVGNLLTIFAVLRSAHMRTVRNFFILNLALSDFFICTVTAPITLYTVLYMFWPFGTALCKIVGSLQGFNIFLSTFSIAAIALDRYVLVIFPTKRDRQHNLSLLFFSLIWLISILLALPLFAASDLGKIFEDKNCGISLTICHEQNERWQQMPLISKEAYTVGVLFVQYAFPLSSIVFVYSSIARRMGNRLTNRNMSMPSPKNVVTASVLVNEDDKNAPKTATTATSVNNNNGEESKKLRRNLCVAIAWLPLNIFHLVNTFNLSHSFSVPTFALCHTIAIFSACLNPLAYGYFNDKFRTEFVIIFNNLGVVWIYYRMTSYSKSLRVKRNKEVRTKSDSLGDENGINMQQNGVSLLPANQNPIINDQKRVLQSAKIFFSLT